MASKPRFFIILTAIIGVATALFIAVAKFYEIRKAVAEAERAQIEAERARRENAPKPSAKDLLAARFGKGSIWKGTHVLGNREYPAK
jgi:hypothetical protein